MPRQHQVCIFRRMRSIIGLFLCAASQASCMSLDATKASLYRSALLGGRGVWARPAERVAASNLVEELEAAPEAPPTLQDGTWELILSDVEPFRASTFFMALGEAVEKQIQVGASDGALTVHSLATGGGEIGRVAHVVEEGGTRLHSLVELKSGSLPSLPLALTGTVVSSGELEALAAPAALAPVAAAADAPDAAEGGGGASPASSSAFSLSLKNTTVQQNRVRYGLPSEGGLKPGVEANVLSWIGDQVCVHPCFLHSATTTCCFLHPTR